MTCVLLVTILCHSERQAESLCEVQKQIERVSSTPEELRKGLQHVLDLDASWPYEKADLLHWAKILDVLDAALANTDSPDDLLVAVLKFTRLLLENSSNRHVYNSYEVRALFNFSPCATSLRFILSFTIICL